MIWKILSQRELTVPIPRQLDRITIYPLVQHVLDENLNAKCSKITFDFAALAFVKPAGVTVLSNLIEFLGKAGTKTVFTNHKRPTCPAISYLDDSGFFNQYLGHSLKEDSSVRSTTLPLKLVEYSRSYEYMGFSLIPWLASALDTPEKSLATIKVCFQEIYNNINDHSKRSIGCSFAQHYPNKNLIDITVSDFGIGIPANVRRLKPDVNDQQALALACEPGFTTKTSVRNHGAGLDVLIKNVVVRNGGAVIIHSNRGIVSCTRQNGSVKKIPRGADGFYPGTLIQLSLDTNRFISDEIEEDFEW
jgi:anti-anti-sigma regulatory factor/anti-sigma regulatory factor (Ser/Thr protein kinase)